MDFSTYFIDAIFSGRLFIPFGLKEVHKELSLIFYFVGVLQIIIISFLILCAFVRVIDDSKNTKSKLKRFLIDSLIMCGIYMILCVLMFLPILLYQVDSISGNVLVSTCLLIFAILIVYTGDFFL